MIIEKRRKDEEKMYIAYLLFVMLGIILVFPVLFFTWMHSVRMEKKIADAIIVLGYKCEENRIHPFLKERLDTAIDLFNNNHYHYIILTGGAVVLGIPKRKLCLAI
ncbi:hypothetical protein [Neobacillus vireti]|uniref:hypothetical protein n=1 Tax=Neobacillus vireti TaxID=220686 RepID=UPI002FFE4F53